MSKKINFAPVDYLGSKKIDRQKSFRQRAFLVVAVSLVTTSAVAGTAQASLLSTFFQKFTPEKVAEYRVFNKPDDKPNTTETIEESADDDGWDDMSYDEEYDLIGENGCNVLEINLNGELGTYYGDTSSDYVRETLTEYGDDDRLSAILVSVDSGGGSPAAGDEIRQLLSEQTLPVVAHVREVGASAAYMAILPADYIFASRFSSVGSIGVIISLYDYSEQHKNEGVKYIPVKTSPMKDIGSSDRTPTAEELAIMQGEVNFVYQDFIDDVAHYRNLSRDQASKLANGTSILAHLAKEAGLVDDVGGLAEVKAYLRDSMGEEPVICRTESSYY